MAPKTGIRMMLATFVLLSSLFSIPCQGEEKKKLPFANDMERFKKADAKNMPPKGATLFVGSSSIGGWHHRLKEDFPGRDVIGRGFGGSQMKHVLMHFDTVVARYEPSIIVIYEGDNDLAGNTDNTDEVIKHYDEFLARVNRQRPNAKVIFIPAKPSIARWEHWPKMKTLNAHMERMARRNRNVWYADTAKAMLSNVAEGTPPRKELFVKDGLHLSPAGYDLWTKLVQEQIDAIDTSKRTN